MTFSGGGILNFGDFVRTTIPQCVHKGQDRRPSQRHDEPDQARMCVHYQSLISPGVSGRGVEGDMGEEGALLLAPDVTLLASCCGNDNNTEEKKGTRLQMVR